MPQPPLRHDCGIFIGYPRVRVDIPQPAAVVALGRLEANMGTGFRGRKGGAHKIANGGADPGNPLISRMTESVPAPARIASLYRYPVKGLTPEPLTSTVLTPGQTLLADRRYAIENGPSGFDPAAPAWLSKPHFLMLMRDEWLAGLRTHFDAPTNVLTIHHNGKVAAQGDLETAEGRAAIENFFTTTFAGQIKGVPKVLSSPGHSFSDVARKVVSIINLSSVRAIENMVDAPVNPLRFRANVYVEGWPAWSEFDLLDRTLAIGEIRLKVVKRIVRCAAVNVDPDTAERDLAIPPALQRRLGHGDCGIYAEVIAGGTIAVGDPITAEQTELL